MHSIQLMHQRKLNATKLEQQLQLQFQLELQVQLELQLDLELLLRARLLIGTQLKHQLPGITSLFTQVAALAPPMKARSLKWAQARNTPA